MKGTELPHFHIPSCFNTFVSDIATLCCFRTSRSSLARVNENFVVWEFSSIRCSQKSRCEPARHPFFSHLGIFPRCSREDLREFKILCTRRGIYVFFS